MSEKTNYGTRSSTSAAIYHLNWLIPLAIAIAVGIAFYPGLDNTFVWDDEGAVVRNEHIHAITPSNLAWMFTTTYTGPYQPLSWLSLAIDCRVWGRNSPWGFHLTSLLLHVASAVVFYYVARRILAGVQAPPKASGSSHPREGGAPAQVTPALCWAAGTAAAFFALHPLRVESVSWVTERRDVLSGLFFLLTVLSYLRYVDAPRDGEGRITWYVAALVLYALGLGSKATGVMLPIVLIVMDVIPLRRLPTREDPWSVGAGRLLYEKVPFLLLALAVGIIAVVGQAQAGAMMDLGKHGVLSRIAVAVGGIGFYVSKTILPTGLCPLYELPTGLGQVVSRLFGSIVLAAAVTVALIVLRRGLPGTATAWLCYIILLLPTLGLVQVGTQMAADRYTYLPSLSLSLILGGAVLALWNRSAPQSREPIFRAPALIPIVATVVLAGLTYRQCSVWYNDVALWLWTARVHPRSAVAYFNLGNAWERIASLGTESERRKKAIMNYEFAVAYRPDFERAWQHLGNALLMQGRHDDAIHAYEQLLKINPNRPDILANESLALLGKGELETATERAKAAVAMDPNDAVAYNTLGMVLVQRGKAHLDEAIHAYYTAMAKAPTYAQPYENVAGLLLALGRYEKAVEVMRLALKNMPDHLELTNSLAFVLATCAQDKIRNGTEALELALRACQETKYQQAHLLDTLAAAYAETGDFERAVSFMQKAIDLTSAKDPDRAARFRERQNQYIAHQPLRRSSY